MRAVFAMALRLRAIPAVLAGVSMALVILMVGALFPSVGDSIGKLHVPDGVANLLGGADYGTITGWIRSEIGAILPNRTADHGFSRRLIREGTWSTDLLVSCKSSN